MSDILPKLVMSVEEGRKDSKTSAESLGLAASWGSTVGCTSVYALLAIALFPLELKESNLGGRELY